MGITIKAARVNKNLTQAEAAELLGITKDALYNYENHRSYPDVRIVQEMVKLYGFSYDELIFLPRDND